MADIDPSQALREARDLARRGAHAEALEKHLWFHENAVKLDPALYGVRLSFALSYWAELAEAYPPARAALESVRDAKTAALRDGSSDRDLFHDVESINHYLGQFERTRELFVEIVARDPEFAGKCFRVALPALVRTRDFALARRFIASPTATLDRFANQLNENVEELSVQASEHSELELEAHVQNYAEDVTRLLDVLVGVGEVDEAELLRAAAIDSIASPAIRERVRHKLLSDVRG